ncbi:hypothetical protein BS50DRAFT_527339 [Corynespora cassiicola Philippines]|uniref:CHAT domain-containing protein n=1 Tax=Corynespora cassiicola Philippines TaxID=1448308 RepID=A0A2T2NI92_CORCC|nr:hypothetical protein BS50DRAFT_527339 [Corynespora cassiicola Philippines]
MPFSKVIDRIGGSVRSAFGVLDKDTEERIRTATQLERQINQQESHYDATGDVEGLHGAIRLLQKGMNMVNEGYSMHVFKRNDSLGEFVHDSTIMQCLKLQRLFFATDDAKVLDQAVSLMRPVYELAPKPSYAYVLEACFLGRAYSYRYFAHGEKNESDKQEAIEMAESALSASKKWKDKVQLLPQDMETLGHVKTLIDMPFEIAKGVYLFERASGFKRKYDWCQDLETLESARSNFSAALALFPPDNKYHNKTAIQVADCELLYIRRTNDVKNLDIALRSINSVDLRNSTADVFISATITKSMLFRAKYDHFSNPADLDRALRTAKEATKPRTNNTHHRVMALENLATQLCRRATLRASVEDIDAAIATAKEAVKESRLLGSSLGANTILSTSFGIKYHLVGGEDNLGASIELLRQVVLALPADHAKRSLRLHNLANGLMDVFKSSGDIQVLEESIQVEREALSAVLNDDPSRYSMLDLLSQLLQARFKCIHNSEDMEEALSASENVLASTNKGHAQYPRRLHSLASILSEKFSRLGNIDDIDRAIKLVSEAISCSGHDEGDLVFYQTTLSSLLSSKFKVTNDLNEIDRAIELMRGVLEKSPASNHKRARMLMNLGGMLQERSKFTEDLEEKSKYLHEALDIQKDCVAILPENDPDMAWYLCTLGYRQALLNVLLLDDDEEQKKENYLLAISSHRKGLEHRFATPSSKIRNGMLAGRCYMSLKDWVSASEILSESIRMFQKVSPLSLDENDRQRQLRGLSGMSMNACMSFIMLGKPEEGATILEAGRGIMANIAIRQHDRLPILEEKSPALHTEYTELRHSLSQPLAVEGKQEMDLVAKLNRDQERFEEIENEIRQLPGLENFNQSMSAKQICQLANRGPLVSFCVSFGFTSYALVIKPDAIDALPLPELDFAEVQKKIPLVTGDNRLSLRPPSKRPAANKQMRALLLWLWDTAVKPVLNHLDLLQDVKPSTLPRLWFVTSGYLGLMPLHAAGKGSKYPKQNAWSHVLPSYTSTCSALQFARDCQSKVSDQPPNVALVTMPHTPARSSLNTEGEAQAVRDAFSTSETSEEDSKLVELCQPTSAQVLERVRGSEVDILHFSCHAEPDLSDPSKTALLFGNDRSADSPDPLPIQNLRKFNGNANLSSRAPQLAYLSACCTAQQYELKLLDENIHLASIFQLMGFPAVNGTLWEADDKAAAFIAKVFYQELFRMSHAKDDQELERDDRIARAFHTATSACRGAKFGRAKGSEDVLLWANFVHFGA